MKKKTKGKKNSLNFGVMRVAAFEPRTLEFPAYHIKLPNMP